MYANQTITCLAVLASEGDVKEILYILGIGLVAGWLAGQLMGGRGFGAVGNIIVGVLGAVAGGWLLSELGVSFGDGLVPRLLTALVGAVVLLFLAALLRKGSKNA